MKLFDIENFFDQDYYSLFQNKNNNNKEVDFILKSTELKPTNKILDIGCGNGRHLSALYAKGFKELLGIDISKELIKMAQKNNSNIEFVCDDFLIHDFNNSKFDIIISFFSGFGYYDDLENENYIKKISEIIQDEGIFLLDIFNITKFIDFYEEGKIYKKDKVENSNKFNPETLINTSCNNIDGDKMYEYKMRMYSIPEIKMILNKYGMDYYKIYGDYDGRDFSFDSNRAILLIKKK